MSLPVTSHLWLVALGHADKERTLRRDRPYERLDVTGVKGLTEAQKTTLHALGAIELPPPTNTR
jgi:hypothetical protein